jgi:hypothetical protein
MYSMLMATVSWKLGVMHHAARILSRCIFSACCQTYVQRCAASWAQLGVASGTNSTQQMSAQQGQLQ